MFDSFFGSTTDASFNSRRGSCTVVCIIGRFRLRLLRAAPVVGVSVAGALIHMLGDGEGSRFGYASVIAGFAIMHLSCTAIVIPLLARHGRRGD